MEYLAAPTHDRIGLVTGTAIVVRDVSAEHDCVANGPSCES